MSNRVALNFSVVYYLYWSDFFFFFFSFYSAGHKMCWRLGLGLEEGPRLASKLFVMSQNRG